MSEAYYPTHARKDVDADVLRMQLECAEAENKQLRAEVERLGKAAETSPELPRNLRMASRPQRPAEPGCKCPYVLQGGMHYPECPLSISAKSRPALFAGAKIWTVMDPTTDVSKKAETVDTSETEDRLIYFLAIHSDDAGKRCPIGGRTWTEHGLAKSANQNCSVCMKHVREPLKPYVPPQVQTRKKTAFEHYGDCGPIPMCPHVQVCRECMERYGVCEEHRDRPEDGIMWKVQP